MFALSDMLAIQNLQRLMREQYSSHLKILNGKMVVPYYGSSYISPREDRVIKRQINKVLRLPGQRHCYTTSDFAQEHHIPHMLEVIDDYSEQCPVHRIQTQRKICMKWSLSGHEVVVKIRHALKQDCLHRR